MKSKLKFFARQSGKRARSNAKRLAALLREYRRDPDSNFVLHSEAAALAVKVSYYLRESEAAGRIILTTQGDRRQVFLGDNNASSDAR